MTSRAKLIAVIATLASTLLLSASLALGVTPRTGSYLGQTGQGELIRFKVSNNGKQVSRFRTKMIIGCPGVGRFSVPVRLPWSEAISPRGRFIYAGSNSVASVRIVGRFPSAKRARGTARLRITDPDVGSCDTGVVRWRARTN